MHLSVCASRTSECPAKTIGTDEIRHHLDVFFGVGAESGKLSIPHAAVGVELESGADEDERHHTVEIEVTAKTFGGVVDESIGAGLVDSVDVTFDQTGGLILLGQTKRETGDGLGYVESLPVIVVVRAMEEGLVDTLLRFGYEAFPDLVAFLGRSKAQEAQCAVSETVLLSGFSKYLSRNRAGGEVDEIVTLKGRFPGGPIKFAHSVGRMARLVAAGCFALKGSDGAVRLDGGKIVAQNGTGHIETLLGETMHTEGVAAWTALTRDWTAERELVQSF